MEGWTLARMQAKADIFLCMLHQHACKDQCMCSSPDFLEEMHMHLQNCFVIHSEMSNRERGSRKWAANRIRKCETNKKG